MEGGLSSVGHTSPGRERGPWLLRWPFAASANNKKKRIKISKSWIVQNRGFDSQTRLTVLTLDAGGKDIMRPAHKKTTVKRKKNHSCCVWRIRAKMTPCDPKWLPAVGTPPRADWRRRVRRESRYGMWPDDGGGSAEGVFGVWTYNTPTRIKSKILLVHLEYLYGQIM